MRPDVPGALHTSYSSCMADQPRHVTLVGYFKKVIVINMRTRLVYGEEKEKLIVMKKKQTKKKLITVCYSFFSTTL